MVINLNYERANGVSDFEKLRSTKHFVDKTEMIATFFDKEIPSYHYITYPNGFGKSISLQMLKLFANIEVDHHGLVTNYSHAHTYNLFKGLKIFHHHDIVKKHLARHPVLHLTFVKIHNVTEEFILGYLNDRLRTCFEEYEWLMKIPKDELTNKKKLHHKYLIGPSEISFLDNLYWQRLTMPEVVQGLRTLSKILAVYFGKRVVILIDQYDHVFGTSLEWDQTTKYVYNKINAMIVHALESHQFVQRALIFGTNSVLPFRETHSVLSRIRHYSFLTEHIFDGFFGFSKHDMEKLHAEMKCSEDESHGIREYYNGYKIIDSHRSIFNPRSVTQYFLNKRGNKTPFRRYWKEEERFLSTVLKKQSIQRVLNMLMQDTPVTFNRVSVYSEVDYLRCRESGSDDLILTALFDRGYLTPTRDDDQFIIPNIEIKLDIQSEMEYLGWKFDPEWTRTRPQMITYSVLASNQSTLAISSPNVTQPVISINSSIIV